MPKRTLEVLCFHHPDHLLSPPVQFLNAVPTINYSFHHNAIRKIQLYNVYISFLLDTGLIHFVCAFGSGFIQADQNGKSHFNTVENSQKETLRELLSGKQSDCWWISCFKVLQKCSVFSNIHFFIRFSFWGLTQLLLNSAGVFTHPAWLNLF